MESKRWSLQALSPYGRDPTFVVLYNEHTYGTKDNDANNDAYHGDHCT